MKIAYPICCGADVHKSFLVATIITTRPQSLEAEYQKKRFSTFNNSLLDFKQWLLANNCRHVCMESTGKYWIPVYNMLEDDIEVTIANPKWVSVVKGNKDDVKDSKWIGELFRLGLVPGSFIPDKQIRLLREFVRYRCKLVAMKASEKNRYQNAFTVCNIALDSVVSSMFGKSATAIADYLTSDAPFDPQHCVTLLHGRLKRKAEQIVEAVEGFRMEPEQKTRIHVIQYHMQAIDYAVNQLDEVIDELAKPFSSHLELLCSIPGVKHIAATTILSEIGTDMSMFGSSKRLCSWAGLVPGNNQSAGKKKSVRITRAGVYLKPALVQAAHAAVRDKTCDYYRSKYQKIAGRRGKKKAIVAIARMILTAVFHMLQTGQTFQPSDLLNEEQLTELREKKQKNSLKEAAKLIQKAGIALPEQFLLSLSG
jgi:transposase